MRRPVWSSAMPRSASSTVELPRLRAAVDGRIITPDDAGYDQARTSFYGRVGRPPAAPPPRRGAAAAGRIITPDAAGSDQARTSFYGGFDRRPAAIVRPADATQI